MDKDPMRTIGIAAAHGKLPDPDGIKNALRAGTLTYDDIARIAATIPSSVIEDHEAMVAACGIVSTVVQGECDECGGIVDVQTRPEYKVVYESHKPHCSRAEG